MLVTELMMVELIAGEFEQWKDLTGGNIIKFLLDIWRQQAQSSSSHQKHKTNVAKIWFGGSFEIFDTFLTDEEKNRKQQHPPPTK